MFSQTHYRNPPTDITDAATKICKFCLSCSQVFFLHNPLQCISYLGFAGNTFKSSISETCSYPCISSNADIFPWEQFPLLFDHLRVHPFYHLIGQSPWQSKFHKVHPNHHSLNTKARVTASSVIRFGLFFPMATRSRSKVKCKKTWFAHFLGLLSKFLKPCSVFNAGVICINPAAVMRSSRLNLTNPSFEPCARPTKSRRSRTLGLSGKGWRVNQNINFPTPNNLKF